jgi:hypothetical protein
MPDFTKGPWVTGDSMKAYEFQSGTVGIFERDRTSGIQIATVVGDLGETESAANASLIAAAPEMYEALAYALEFYDKALKNLVRCVPGIEPGAIAATERAFEHARAAIAKADEVSA